MKALLRNFHRSLSSGVAAIKSPANRSFSSLVIKNGVIINADRHFKGNVRVEDGKIVDVVESETDFNQVADTVIDAEGKYVIPGGIDPHVHLEMPFMGTNSIDGYMEGTRAGIAGGTTTLIDFIIPAQGQNLVDAYKEWKDRADKAGVCSDFSFHCGITYWDETVPDAMEKLVNEYGVTSFKVFLAYKGSLMISDEDCLKVMQVAKKLGAVVMCHCENGDMVDLGQKKMHELGIESPKGHMYSRPNEIVEQEATHRAIALARFVNTPLYVVHVMSPGACDEVHRGRESGQVIFGETLASALGVDGTHLENPEFRHASGYVMSPPLSTDPHAKTELMKRLACGQLQVVSTDNCTFMVSQKELGLDSFDKIPNGCNGIEDRLSLVHSEGVEKGLLSVCDFVRVTSTAAAQIFNLYPRKGVIQKGSDADIVVFDPNSSRIVSAKTHHHKVDFNIFEGMKLNGIVHTTISGGVVKYSVESNQDTNEFIETFVGTGNLLQRKPFGYAFERIPAIDKQIEAEAYGKKTFDNVSHPMRTAVQASGDDLLAKIVYGGGSNVASLTPSVSSSYDGFDLLGYYGLKDAAKKEQTRSPRVVRVGCIQHSIVLPTDQPVQDQKNAIFSKIEKMIDAAAKEEANVLCLQEAWNMPFAFCTREMLPWTEFAEDVSDGESFHFISDLAKRHNMVIISPILEYDNTQGILHNTCAFIDNNGKLIGRHEKNHIPRVGDFNESTYYGSGKTGWPVFTTEFGKIAANICYGRHHPLNWMCFGLNGAEIVFNPCATVDALSESLWAIEARNAAIANSYFTVAINRVGSETFPHEFTSGDGKPAHTDFGQFFGSSYISCPNGQRTPSLSREHDGILLSDIDLNQCKQVNDEWKFKMTMRLDEYAKFLNAHVKSYRTTCCDT